MVGEGKSIFECQGFRIHMKPLISVTRGGNTPCNIMTLAKVASMTPPESAYMKLVISYENITTNVSSFGYRRCCMALSKRLRRFTLWRTTYWSIITIKARTPVLGGKFFFNGVICGAEMG